MNQLNNVETIAAENIYLRAFLDDQAEEIARTLVYRQRYEAIACPRFFENCRTWLIGMWNEIEPDDVTLSWKSDYWTCDTHPVLRLGFTWNRLIPGVIESNVEGPVIVFKIADDVKRFELPCLPGDSKSGDYDQQALELDPVRFGEFLDRVLDAYSKQAQYKQEKEKRRRLEKLARIEKDITYAYTLEKLESLLKDALEIHPHQAARWHELADQQRQIILQYQQKQTEQEARDKDYQAEQEAIEKAARQAFIPFTIYEITSAFGVDVEHNACLETFYSHSSDPDPDGWWRVNLIGEIRRAKLPVISSIVEKRVEWGSALMRTLCRRETLVSEKYPEIQVCLYRLPNENG